MKKILMELVPISHNNKERQAYYSLYIYLFYMDLPFLHVLKKYKCETVRLSINKFMSII